MGGRGVEVEDRGGRGGAEPRCLEEQSTLQLWVTPKIKLGRGAGQARGGGGGNNVPLKSVFSP